MAVAVVLEIVKEEVDMVVEVVDVEPTKTSSGSEESSKAKAMTVMALCNDPIQSRSRSRRVS